MHIWSTMSLHDKESDKVALNYDLDSKVHEDAVMKKSMLSLNKTKKLLS